MAFVFRPAVAFQVPEATTSKTTIVVRTIGDEPLDLTGQVDSRTRAKAKCARRLREYVDVHYLADLVEIDITRLNNRLV